MLASIYVLYFTASSRVGIRKGEAVKTKEEINIFLCSSLLDTSRNYTYEKREEMLGMGCSALLHDVKKAVE